jgi:hypothetical protein
MLTAKTRWGHRIAKGLGVASLAVALACSSSSGTGSDPQVVLDGVYQTSGAFSWTAFHDGNYTLWSSAPACSGNFADAPSTCAHEGTFDFDSATSVLTLVDGTTGAVATIALSQLQFDPGSASLSSVHVLDLTTGPSSSLTSGGGSLTGTSPGALSGFSAQPLTTSSGTGVQLASNWMTTLYLACQLILSPPLSPGTPSITDIPPNPPITSTCKKK